MTATLFDLEVYADRYSEMLETQELEYQQSLEDAAEETAFNNWADRDTEYCRDELHESNVGFGIACVSSFKIAGDRFMPFDSKYRA